MKKGLVLGVVSLALVTGAMAQVSSTSGQTSNVTVNVAGVTALDVRPSEITYNSVTPGDTKTSSLNGYQYIELENIGSNEIGEIYAEATMPEDQPFGDSSTNYDSGNFVTVSLDKVDTDGYGPTALRGGENTAHFLNRVEYFEENPPTYIDTVSDTETLDINGTTSWDVNEVHVGRLRVGAADYFFAAYQGSSSQRALRIGDTPHTPTQLGTTDLSDSGDDYSQYTVAQGNLTSQDSEVYIANSHEIVNFNSTEDGNFAGNSLIDAGSATSIDSNTNLSSSNVDVRSYNLIVDFDRSAANGDGYVYRTRYNVEPETPGYVDGTGSDEFELSNLDGSGSIGYFVDATDTGEGLLPGQNFPVNFGIQVPAGVAQGAVDSGTVRVTATSDTSSD